MTCVSTIGILFSNEHGICFVLDQNAYRTECDIHNGRIRECTLHVRHHVCACHKHHLPSRLEINSLRMVLRLSRRNSDRDCSERFHRKMIRVVRIGEPLHRVQFDDVDTRHRLGNACLSRGNGDAAQLSGAQRSVSDKPAPSRLRGRPHRKQKSIYPARFGGARSPSHPLSTLYNRL